MKASVLSALCIILACLKGLSSVKSCTRYTDSTLVGNLRNFDTVIPKPENCPIDCELYLDSTSALGYNGPLGALGPLGTLGPVSSNVQWSPADNFAWIGSFSDYMIHILGHKTLLNHPENPLSQYGPLGDSFWDVMLTEINDFTKHMQGLGLWSILGPIGPLGPLGALGPLGPVGAHGFQVTDNGDYVDLNGNIQRKISAVYNSTRNVTWPLFERYANKRYVDKLSENGELDTSFMVLSTANTSPDVYIMKITEPQYISILITPVIWAKNFIFDIYLDDQFLVTSDKILYTEWIQIYVSKNDFIKRNNKEIKLKLKIRSDPFDCGFVTIFGCPMDYYLHVVGSTEFMLRRPHQEYSGSYIKECN